MMLPNKGIMTGQAEQTRESPVHAGESPVSIGESPVSEEENWTLEIDEFEIRLRSSMALLSILYRNNTADFFEVRMSNAWDIINRMVKGGFVNN